jgi:hypothetical protein
MIGLSEFVALSARLTGRSGLDPKIASLYLAALTADRNKRRRLANLVHGAQNDADLEREIILYWYTGIYKSGKEARLATYREAVLWKAAKIAAPGTCAGPFGFWAQPPAEAGQ